MGVWKWNFSLKSSSLMMGGGGGGGDGGSGGCDGCGCSEVSGLFTMGWFSSGCRVELLWISGPGWLWLEV